MLIYYYTSDVAGVFCAQEHNRKSAPPLLQYPDIPPGHFPSDFPDE